MDIAKNAITGIVVLYNPGKENINYIKTYLPWLDYLLIFDNSSNDNRILCSELLSSNNTFYVWEQENKGVAYALNYGLNFATQNNSNWLLTMDQDSYFNSYDFQRMLDNLNSINAEHTAIISPIHHRNYLTRPQKRHKHVVMTSGNLVNVNLANKIGKFEEKLFIDSVDTEFCLKLQSHGYKIERINSIILNHTLGSKKNIDCLLFKVSTTNHSSIRRYYMTRNRFYVWKKYNKQFPTYVRLEKILTLKEFIKMLFFEKNKWAKLKMSFKGYIDFRKNKWGAYSL